MNTYFVNTKNSKNGKYIVASNKTEARKTFANIENIKNFRTIEVKLHSKNTEEIEYNND